MPEQEVFYDISTRLTKEELEQILSDIETMAALVSHQDKIFMHILEKSPPIFLSIIQKFVALNMIMNESIIETQMQMNGVLAEMWCMKIGTKESEA